MDYFVYISADIFFRVCLCRGYLEQAADVGVNSWPSKSISGINAEVGCLSLDHFLLIVVACVLFLCLIFVKFLQIHVVGFTPEPDRLTMYGFYNILQPIKTVLLLLVKQTVLSMETAGSKTNQVFYITALILYFGELVSSTSLRVFYDPILNLLTILKSILLFAFTTSELLVIYRAIGSSSLLINLWTISAALIVWAPVAAYMHKKRFVGSLRRGKYHQRPRVLLDIIFSC